MLLTIWKENFLGVRRNRLSWHLLCVCTVLDSLCLFSHVIFIIDFSFFQWMETKSTFDIMWNICKYLLMLKNMPLDLKILRSHDFIHVCLSYELTELLDSWVFVCILVLYKSLVYKTCMCLAPHMKCIMFLTYNFAFSTVRI